MVVNVLTIVPGVHVSGSAYKIVNKRAYHHGTMLISSELGTLGKLLNSNKVFIKLVTLDQGSGVDHWKKSFPGHDANQRRGIRPITRLQPPTTQIRYFT
jgi:hypothetical protein